MRRILPYSLLLALVFQIHAFQLPDQVLHHYQCKRCAKLSRSMLSTSWLIEDKNMVPAEFKPVKSKRYYRKITGKDLKQGVDLGLVGDGAVIRVTPIKPQKLDSTWQQQFVIKTDQEKKPLMDMVQSLTDEHEFKQQFSVGPAMILQLKPGLFQHHPNLVYNDASLDDNSQWQLSVYDRYSDLYLSVALDKSSYQIGDEIKAVIEVADDFSFPDINWVEARIMGPTGEGMAVPLQEDGSFRYYGSSLLQMKEVTQGENWYFMVMADMVIDGTHTLRAVSAAFSYAVPSAKVRSIYQPSSLQPLALKARVEAIQASRFQLQAVVYATGDDGEIHSVALAQTSAWLKPGITELPLEVDTPLPSNMHSPYYLGQIELVDDAQLKPVHRYNEKIPFTELDS